MWKRALIVCGICILLSSAQHTIKIDDALIYARYVQNALSGHGLVFNPGERVNALTSPLMGYLVLLASWLLHGRILMAEMILSAVFLAGACSLAECMVPFSGILLASTAYFYTCFGMETSLFLLLLLLCVFLYIKEQYFWLPLVCTLASLTRFEGGLLAILLLWRLWQERRIPSWKSFVAPAIAVAGYLTFNLSYYGRFLPFSTTAKMLHGQSGMWGRWPFAFFYLGRVIAVFHGTPFIIPVTIALALFAAWKQRGSKLNKIVLPFILGLLSFYVLFNLSPYPWYLAPFIFFALLYAVLALPKTRITQIAVTLVAVYCAVTGARLLRDRTQNREYILAAQWLNQNSSPTATVAAIETGLLGFDCPRYIDDIAGLTTPKNAVLLAHHDAYSWLEQDKPDYVIMHSPALLNEIAAASSPNYTRVKTFSSVYLLHRVGAPR